MAKTFKKFRNEWYEDSEWGDNDDEMTRKERKLQNRRDRRKKKVDEKFAALEERDLDDE